MKEEIITQEIIEKDTYASRKGKTYEFTGTKSEDWKPANIISYSFVDGRGEVAIYDVKGYSEIDTPYRKANKFVLGKYTCCQLCGHGIRVDNQHALINELKKIVMWVGCECIHKHHGKVVRETIKTFVMNDLRKQFDELRNKSITLLDTYLDVSEKYTNEHNNYALRTKRLEPWAYNFKNDLEKIETNKAGKIKLKNRIESMKKLLLETKPKDISNLNIIECITNLNSLVGNTNNEAIITFGKYKDKKFSDVPESYIEWAKNKVEETR